MSIKKRTIRSIEEYTACDYCDKEVIRKLNSLSQSLYSDAEYVDDFIIHSECQKMILLNAIEQKV